MEVDQRQRRQKAAEQHKRSLARGNEAAHADRLRAHARQTEVQLAAVEHVQRAKRAQALNLAQPAQLGMRYADTDLSVLGSFLSDRSFTKNEVACARSPETHSQINHNCSCDMCSHSASLTLDRIPPGVGAVIFAKACSGPVILTPLCVVLLFVCVKVQTALSVTDAIPQLHRT